jgi:RNA polymerase sigma-70 factor (ECF subfamily)
MRPTTPTASELPGDLGAVYEAEGPRLWRAVYAYAGDRDVASDAVAEAFAQCLRRGAAIRDQRAWVWRAAFRIAAGELQRRRRVTDRIPEDTYEMPDDPRRLLDALAQLSPAQRGVLVLRHYAGEPTDRIAAALGMSRATVRVHLSRGRKRLATLLEDHDDA